MKLIDYLKKSHEGDASEEGKLMAKLEEDLVHGFKIETVSGSEEQLGVVMDALRTSLRHAVMTEAMLTLDQDDRPEDPEPAETYDA